MKENTSALHVQLPVDVATYLLNEKRAEIYDIEVRQRISIVLIPNIHIETPTYNITRIRHEDSKANESVASYKLVEKNSEENNPVISEQRNKPTRPQAAVQGITPAQPAPIREDRSRDTSLLDKFFSWFKPAYSEETRIDLEEKPFDMDKTRQQERGRSRGRRGRNRNERKDTSAQKPAKQSDAPDSTGAAQDLNNPESGQSPQYNPVAAESPRNNSRRVAQPATAGFVEAAEITDISAAETESAESSGTKPDERRRSRRHRGNKNRDHNGQVKNAAENHETVADAVPGDAVQLDEHPISLQPVVVVAEPIPVNEDSPPPAAKKQSSRRAPAVNQTVQNSTIQPESSSAPAPIAEISVPKELPDLSKSGLIMIETPPEKVEMVTEEIIIPKRPRRRVRKAATPETEPLMQVETRE